MVPDATCLGCGDPAPWGEPCPRCGIVARQEAGLLEFTVPGRPVPWARTRGKGGRRFTPARQREHGERLGWLALEAGASHTDRPVRLEVIATYALPQSEPSRVYPRTDVDNLAKQVMDALQGVVWDDDDQVVELVARKRYGTEASTVVRITPLAEPSR